MQADRSGTRSGHRSSRSSSSRTSGGSKAFLQAPGTARGLAIIMGLMAIGYAAAGAASFYGQIGGYSDIPMGASGAEVQYFAGKPGFVRSGGQAAWAPSKDLNPEGQWLYRGEGMAREVQFSAGRVSRIACTGPDCPMALGVREGHKEAAVLGALGRPTSEFVTPGRKVMRYADIGYEIVLENSEVRQIVAIERRPGLFRLLGRFLLWLLP